MYSIREKVLDAIDEAFKFIAENDYISFILFIGRADYISGLKPFYGTDYVIDYQLDSIYDETRSEFYIRYLNRNYSRDGFSYEGDEGIDDMHIELMIYSHLWDSSYFIKSLMRMASIVCGNGYLWEAEIDWMHKDVFMQKKIIQPLIASGLKLGNIIERFYDPSVRNAFAHSLYTVDPELRTLTVRPRKGIKSISFEDFQSMFLHSVLLMNKMENALEANHNQAAKLNTALTDVFTTPDGARVQVFGEIVKRGESLHPEFKMKRIIEG